MMRCRVLGKYTNTNGRAIGNSAIEIRPFSGVVTARGVQSDEPVQIKTADDGVFVAWLVPGKYKFTFANKQSYTVTVPNQARARFEQLVATAGGDR